MVKTKECSISYPKERKKKKVTTDAHNMVNNTFGQKRLFIRNNAERFI